MTSDGKNVAELSDEDLYERLKEFGVDVGPIVGKCYFASVMVRWIVLLHHFKNVIFV